MVESTLVKEILREYKLPLMGTHGLPHWARVLDNGMKLAERSGASRRIVALFAVFHDARRENEGGDPEHGRRAARLAVALRERHLELSNEDFELLRYACEYHADGLTAGHISVRTCWDADRLDLWRIGITPRSDLLCTEAARSPELQQWAKGRSLADHVPNYVTEEWLTGMGRAG